jgi:hypothetical protein
MECCAEARGAGDKRVKLRLGVFTEPRTRGAELDQRPWPEVGMAGRGASSWSRQGKEELRSGLLGHRGKEELCPAADGRGRASSRVRGREAGEGGTEGSTSRRWVEA